MYQHVPEAHESREVASPPSVGATLVWGIVVVVFPLLVTVVASYPTFGVGIAAGISLRYGGRQTRRLVIGSPKATT